MIAKSVTIPPQKTRRMFLEEWKSRNSVQDAIVILHIRKLSKKSISGFQENAPLVQLVERWSPKPNVVGSSPTGRVFFKNIILCGRGSNSERIKKKSAG